MGGPPGAMTIYPSMTIIGRPQCAARTRFPRDLVESPPSGALGCDPPMMAGGRYRVVIMTPAALFRHSPPRVGTVDGVE
jgi:hypothetical protein